jgi:hypothetical protein
MIGSWFGKVSVDGYIYQAGSIVYAKNEFNMPFSINVTVNIKDARVTLRVSPPSSVSILITNSFCL